MITPAGVKALQKAEAKLETLEGEVLANLDVAERERLGDLLSRAMEGQDPAASTWSALEELAAR